MKDKIYLIANSHIDPVWLWKKGEGLSEVKSTFRSVLDRMNEFPDYIFTCACACYYQWIEQVAPEMFEEIKKRVEEGRWKLAGGFWIQPDCNIPSGEAFVRQALYSQGYFREKFGQIATFGYNVDSFGHNGMLPQILKKSGMKDYVFQRPDMTENKEIEKSLFVWVSPDGSEVTTYRLPIGYGSSPGSDKERYAKTRKIADEQQIPQMCFYGIGNHGGAIAIRTLKDLNEVVDEYKGEVLFASPEDYFKDVKEAGFTDNAQVIKGDLQHHASGCYAANSKVKAYNRKTENALVAAEKYDTLASELLGNKKHTWEFKMAWEKVMFNQFHDILAGCSIKDAYEDAYNSFGSACDSAWEISNLAVQSISWNICTTRHFSSAPCERYNSVLWEKEGEGAPIVIFNPNSFPVKAPVKINESGTQSIVDADGTTVDFQVVRGPQSNGDHKETLLFMPQVPALGYATYYFYRNNKLPLNNLSKPVAGKTENGEYYIENSHVKVAFDEKTGYIKSYYDKENNRELVKTSMAKPIVIDDTKPDTWAHAIFEFNDEVGAFSDAELELTEVGPLRVTMKVTNKFNDSKLIQYFSLYHDDKKLEVYCKLDFHEKLKLLKLSFDLNTENPRATYSMPYGFIEKKTDGLQEPSQMWTDVSDESGYGIALLNDCKYSFDVKDSNMKMIIARGCIYADHYWDRSDIEVDYIDQGEQFFTYILYPHNTKNFAPVVKEAELLNQPLTHILETHHEGKLENIYSGIDISADNVIVETVKYAEKLNGIVVRLYETAGNKTNVTVKLNFIEKEFNVSLNQQEIKTMFIPSDETEIREINLIEEI